jgi:predicted DNA binding protein
MRLRDEFVPLLNILESCTHLGYVERSKKRVRTICRIKIIDGRNIDELDELPYIKVVEIIAEPDNVNDFYIAILEISHQLTMKSVSVGNLTVLPGSRFDSRGLTYTIRGGRSSIRAVVALCRALLRPDSISAGNVSFDDLPSQSISERQYEVLSTAFEMGWYSAPRGCRLEDIARRLELSRSTVAEHLVNAESVIVGQLLDGIPNWLVSDE